MRRPTMFFSAAPLIKRLRHILASTYDIAAGGTMPGLERDLRELLADAAIAGWHDCSASFGKDDNTGYGPAHKDEIRRMLTEPAEAKAP